MGDCPHRPHCSLITLQRARTFALIILLIMLNLVAEKEVPAAFPRDIIILLDFTRLLPSTLPAATV